MPRLLSDLSSNKTTALVAGGAGFVGSYLCEHLLALGTQVIAIDNFVTGKHENVNHLLRDENFYLIEGDINDQHLFEELHLPVKINYIFHLASVEEYVGDKTKPFDVLDTNSRGVENLLSLAVKNNSKFLFVSSLDIFTASVYLSNLNGDMSKQSTWDNQNYHEGKKFSELLVSDYYKRFKLDLRVVRLGQVYGPRMNLSSGSIMSNLYCQAVGKNVISIPANNSEEIFPVYVSDTVAGILRAMFMPGSSGEIFQLYDKNGTTLISLAHKIKKIVEELHHKDIVIEYSQPTYRGNIDKTSPANYPSGWELTVSEEEGIDRTVKWLSGKLVHANTTFSGDLSKKMETMVGGRGTTVAKEENPIKTDKITTTADIGASSNLRINEKTNNGNIRGNILRVIKTVLLTLFFGLIFSFSVFGYYLLSCNQNLKEIQRHIKNGEVTGIKTEAVKLARNALAAEIILEKISGVPNIFGLVDKITTGEKTLSLARLLGESLISLVDLADSGSKLSEYMIGDSNVEPEEVIMKLELQNENSLEKISLVQGILDTYSGQEQLIGKKMMDLKELIPEIKNGLLTSRDLLKITPSLVGIKGKVSYLVLFQNNMELRPGGGFIGSYAIVDFVNGKLANFKVNDVYSADGQLKGHVEPPPKLKEYLNVDGWYLRDSNWNVDFPENSLKAEWFLDKETGITVDGVISVNLNVIQKILRATNEIYLSDYDEKINADNFFEKAEYRTEAGFFPGSTQKGDYLGNVSRVMMEIIRNSDEQMKGKVILAVFESLTQKDIMVYSHDPKTAKILMKNNWDGSIKTPNCSKINNNCFRDYLQINDANVGVNKANYYLTRAVDQDINISSSGKVDETVNIKYENSSPNNIFPAGDYKSYTRVLVPLGSEIKNCEIYSQDDNLSPEKCTVVINAENRRTSFGVYVNVPVGEKRRVALSYSLPAETIFTGGDYLLFIQKQSGIMGDKYQTSITYPESLSLVWSNQPLLTKGGTIVYNTSLLKDTSLEIGFEK